MFNALQANDSVQKKKKKKNGGEGEKEGTKEEREQVKNRGNTGRT